MKSARLIIAGGIAAATATTVLSGTAHAAPSARDTGGWATAANAASAAVAKVRPPTSKKLKLTGQRQQSNMWCVPASSSMSLSTFGIKASQKTLAKKMKTNSKGTYGKYAIPVLNTYVKSRKFYYSTTGDVANKPAQLQNRVSYTIGTLNRAPVLAVWMEKLPWNKGKVHGKKVGHAIVAYGYNNKTKTITVYDPWRPTGGTHTISAAKLAPMLQPGGGYFIFKR